MDVLLIAGGTTKSNRPDQARFFYRGHQFRCSRRFAEDSGLPWGIVSVKFGLVWPTSEVSPYIESLAHYDSDRKRRWAVSIAGALSKLYTPSSTRIIFLGTALYMEPLGPALEQVGFTTWLPWKGKDLHGQMSMLTQLTQTFKRRELVT